MVDVQDLKRMLPMEEVARHYGFEPNRSGFICCPFHGEKTASLKIYPGDRGWHCFGCGEGGDVIRFVMKLFGLTFPQALTRLKFDFGLSDIKPAAGKPLPAPEPKVGKDKEMASKVGKLRRMYSDIVCGNEGLYRAVEAGRWDEVPEWYLDACTDLEWCGQWLREYDERQLDRRWEDGRTG